MKISERDIQLFVGGALALMGFRALISLPNCLVVSLYSPQLIIGPIIGLILSGVALPIGIGILMGRVRAVRLAQVYLWLVVISGCAVTAAFYHDAPTKIGRILWGTSPDILQSIVLLGIIFWSVSRRSKREPAA